MKQAIACNEFVEAGVRNNRHWRAEDINFTRIELPAIRDDGNIFLVLAASSFLEITAPLYARNLAEFNRGRSDIADWLLDKWMLEEIEHGRAMKAYVQNAWPEFDWDRAYAGFSQEFHRYCGRERYQPSPALEMLARCVTETGAATSYKALRDASREPVLRAVLDQMQRDEVRHYKYFLRYFHEYNEEEKNSRAMLLKVVTKRALRVCDEDMLIAFKYAQPDGAERRDYIHTVLQLRRLTRPHYPVEQAVKMIAQPLGLSGSAREFPIRVLRSVAAVI
jgi:hypothetical protein